MGSWEAGSHIIQDASRRQPPTPLSDTGRFSIEISTVDHFSSSFLSN